MVSLGLAADALTRVPTESVSADDATVPGVERRKGFEVVWEPDVIGVEQRDQRSIDLSDRLAPRGRRPGVSLERHDGNGQQRLPSRRQGGSRRQSGRRPPRRPPGEASAQPPMPEPRRVSAPSCRRGSRRRWHRRQAAPAAPSSSAQGYPQESAVGFAAAPYDLHS